MKKLIVYFIVLLLAVLGGLWMHAHPGYVLIGVANTRIEASLWLAVFALIVLVIVFYWLLRLLVGIFRIPRRFHSFRKRRERNQILKLSERGEYELLSENWHKAEQDLAKAAKKPPRRVLNYLGAAKAARAQNNDLQRDQYLENARKLADGRQRQAIIFTEVRWQIANANWDAALKTLEPLQQALPRHPFVLMSLKQIYYAKQDWEHLQKLLPKLKKQHLLTDDEARLLEHEVYLALMAKARLTNQPQVLEKIWHSLPDYLRREPQVLATYTEYLIEEGNQEKAESLLKVRLKKSLEAPLLQQYAKVLSSDSAKQLSRAESWLEKNPHNAALLYCLGQLCIRHRLWGKARNYLEASLKQAPSAPIYIALGEVDEHLGEKSAALECYREGLKLVSRA
ncbi:MAG TPA: heme biosynthesis HemY N-terminal domain-containing protein [Gammaproteobacteria bacterium]|nr:heme biosynthesis HemY N-terminal domain-containing protein [Gammaproteobacteria bacterium]